MMDVQRRLPNGVAKLCIYTYITLENQKDGVKSLKSTKGFPARTNSRFVHMSAVSGT
jgi:hypothetical protein